MKERFDPGAHKRGPVRSRDLDNFSATRMKRLLGAAALARLIIQSVVAPRSTELRVETATLLGMLIEDGIVWEMITVSPLRSNGLNCATVRSYDETLARVSTSIYSQETWLQPANREGTTPECSLPVRFHEITLDYGPCDNDR